MSVTDYPTWDGKGEDEAHWLFCDSCGRPIRSNEDMSMWVCEDNGDMTCPHCAAVAEAEGQEQADKQVTQ